MIRDVLAAEVLVAGLCLSIVIAAVYIVLAVSL